MKLLTRHTYLTGLFNLLANVIVLHNQFSAVRCCLSIVYTYIKQGYVCLFMYWTVLWTCTEKKSSFQILKWVYPSSWLDLSTHGFGVFYSTDIYYIWILFYICFSLRRNKFKKWNKIQYFWIIQISSSLYFLIDLFI